MKKKKNPGPDKNLKPYPGEESPVLVTEGSKGLGDTIAKVTSKLGIKPCGACNKRKEKLNRLIPYKKRGNKER